MYIYIYTYIFFIYKAISPHSGVASTQSGVSKLAQPFWAAPCCPFAHGLASLICSGFVAINFSQNCVFQLWFLFSTLRYLSHTTHQSMTSWKFESKLGTSWHWLLPNGISWDIHDILCLMWASHAPSTIGFSNQTKHSARWHFNIRGQKIQRLTLDWPDGSKKKGVKEKNENTRDLKVTASRYAMCQRDARRNLLSWAGDLSVDGS